MQWVQNLPQGEYVYRGVSNEKYPIEASTYRRLKDRNGKIRDEDKSAKKLLQINREMIEEANRHRHGWESGQPPSDLNLLAKLQHIGAATCLIDFTKNPLVALWMAGRQSSGDSVDGKVYAVKIGPGSQFEEVNSQDALKKKIHEFFQSDGKTGYKLYQWQPHYQDNRMLAQQSIFLFGGGWDAIKASESCVISEKHKKGIWDSLKKSTGISGDILFPDFEGFASQRAQNKAYDQPDAAVDEDPVLALQANVTAGTTNHELEEIMETVVTYCLDISLEEIQAGNIEASIDYYNKAQKFEPSGELLNNYYQRRDGIAQTYLRLGNRVGTTTIEARLGDLTPVTFTAQSESSPSRITLVSGNNQTVYRNTQSENPLRVRVTDTNRNGIADVTVNFRITSGRANLADANVRTDANGYAETHVTPTSTASVRVEARVTGINTTARFSVNVRRAPTRLIQISGDDQTGALNRRLAQPFIVEVRDDAGDPLSGITVRFEVATGGGRLSTTTARSNANGRAQTYLTLGNTSVENRVVASVSGISAEITFTAGFTTRVFVNAANRPPIYWLDAGNRISQLTDDEIEPFRENVHNVTCLTVADEKVYWGEEVNNSSGRLRLANLDGSGVQEIRSVSGVPRGIAVDTENSRVYWTNSRGQIQRVNTNGTGLQTPITQLNNPTHIVLDVPEGQFYWSESGRIRRANFNGSNRQVVAVTPNPVGGIAIANGKIHWTERISQTRGNIRRANLNGSSVAVLAQLRSVPFGIAVDSSTRKLYWANSRGRIQRSNLNGSFIQNIVDGLGTPSAIAISTDTPTPPRPTENYSDSDINRDGAVDTTDLRLVANALGESPPTNRRTDVDGDGTVTISDLLIVINNLESGAAPPAPSGVNETALLPNYPNPFNPETWIPYQLKERADVQINIYSAEGTLIRKLLLGYQPGGYYLRQHRAAHWDGRNENGERVASGIYFYELVTDGTPSPILQKMLIVK